MAPVELTPDQREVRVAEMLVGHSLRQSYIDATPTKRTSFKILWQKLEQRVDARFVVGLMALEIDQINREQRELGQTPITAIAGFHYGNRFSLPLAELLKLPHIEAGESGWDAYVNYHPSVGYIPPWEYPEGLRQAELLDQKNSPKPRRVALVDDWVSSFRVLADIATGVSPAVDREVFALLGIVGNGVETRVNNFMKSDGGGFERIRILTSVDKIRQNPHFNPLIEAALQKKAERELAEMYDLYFSPPVTLTLASRSRSSSSL